MRARRPSSFSASFFTSSGMPAASIFCRSSSASRVVLLLAQFLLDGLHLLAQVVLALRLLHPILHFALNLVAELLNFKLLGQVLVDLLQANINVGRLQHVLLVARRERRQRRADEVDHAAGIVDVRSYRGQLVR